MYKIVITTTDNQTTLTERLTDIACQLLDQTLNNLASITPVPQDHKQATYTKKIVKTDARIDWRQSAEVIERQVRAYHPWPVAFASHKGIRLRVWQAAAKKNDQKALPGTIVSVSSTGMEVACGHDVLAIQVLQFPGKQQQNMSQIYHQLPSGYHVGMIFDALDDDSVSS